MFRFSTLTLDGHSLIKESQRDREKHREGLDTNGEANAEEGRTNLGYLGVKLE